MTIPSIHLSHPIPTYSSEWYEHASDWSQSTSVDYELRWTKKSLDRKTITQKDEKKKYEKPEKLKGKKTEIRKKQKDEKTEQWKDKKMKDDEQKAHQ